MRRSTQLIFTGRLLAIAVALLFAFPGQGRASSFVDRNYIHWTVGVKNEAQEIVYADESFLYLIIDGEMKKVNRNFGYGLESLTPQEEESIKQKSQTDTGMTDIDSSLLTVEGHTLFYEKNPILDVAAYQEKNRNFYLNRPDLQPQPVAYKASFHQSASGLELLLVTSCPEPDVPAPYTGYYGDLIVLDRGQALHLTALERFTPQQVVESQDGTLWVSGTQNVTKFLNERSLFRIDTQSRLQSLNQSLRCNDIHLLQANSNHVIVWAGTHTFYFDPDPARYDKGKDRIYCIDSAGAAQVQPEEIGDISSMVYAPGDEIYGVSFDGKSLINLTGKQVYPMRNQDDYEEIQAMIDSVKEKETLESSPTRVRFDQDGSQWLIKNGQAVHSRSGVEEVFYGGQDVLLNGMENIFVDGQNGKWFLSVAGVGFMASGSSEVKNMNPILPASYPGADKRRMFVDSQDCIWYFGAQIQRLPFQSTIPAAASDPQTDGFTPLEQNYIEYQNKAYFAYQKSNEDQSVTLRLFTIDGSGQLNHQDYSLTKKGMDFFARDGVFYVNLADGFWRLEGQRAMVVCNPCLNKISWSHYCLDTHRLGFATAARNVLVDIPEPGDLVDTFARPADWVEGFYPERQTALVNNVPIASFLIQAQGKNAICVEDLQYYGFDMVWDPVKRSTFLSRAVGKKITGDSRGSSIKSATGNIYASDVEIYITGEPIRSYNTGGYSLVAIDDLDNVFNIRKEGATVYLSDRQP
ncbi:MAG TPA: hypothetical protein VN426_07005 [Syntrophomonadaceae bacterium]|nr:hypothetical protein [Syntrophomonadaceae bacterium]